MSFPEGPSPAAVGAFGDLQVVVLVALLATFDVGCIGYLLGRAILWRMAKGKRGKDHTTTSPKPGGKSDGRLAENGGGQGGAKRGPKVGKGKSGKSGK